jgi:hypothetical protein
VELVVEWSGGEHRRVALVSWIEAEEAVSGGEVKISCGTHKRKGRGALGLSPSWPTPYTAPLRLSCRIGPGRMGLEGHGLAFAAKPGR